MLDSVITPIDLLGHIGVPTNIMTAQLQFINPTNDINIDSFMQVILNLQRELAIRSGRFRHGYWQKLTQGEALIAEAEADWLREAIRDMCVAMRMYTLSRLPQGEDESFLSADMAAEVIKQKNELNKWTRESERLIVANDRPGTMQPMDIARRTVEYDAASLLVPTMTPLAQNELLLMRMRVNEAIDKFELYSRPLERELHALARHRDVVTPFYSELTESACCMLADIQNAHAQLGGKNPGSPPMVLINESIPGPRASSWFGWWQACGVVMRELTLKEASKVVRWFDGGLPRFIMTYIPPFMPRTHEHMTGGQVVAGGQGDASWSLGSRSKLHDRDSEGRIRYGDWRARTVIIGDDKGEMKSRLVADIAFDSMSMSRLGLHELALDTLPGMESTAHLMAIRDYRRFIGIKRFEPEEVIDLKAALMNPGVAGTGDFLPFLPFYADQVITRMASLASNWSVHFRFDETLSGLEALSVWSQAFEEEAWGWIRTNHHQHMQEYMRDSVNRVYNVRNPKQFAHVNRGGVRTVFDFTGL